MNLTQEQISEIIIEEYPDADNKVLASKLRIKEQTLRSRASKLGVKKSESFMKEYYKELHKNKRNEVYKFLDIVKLYIMDIPTMKYKIDLKNKFKVTKDKFKDKYPDKNIKISSKITVDNSYSKEDEENIIHMISMGFSYKEIAESLGRSYYRLYDKVMRMKI